MSRSFACNSPRDISTYEFIPLELQRFQILLNFHPNELHAKFWKQVTADTTNPPRTPCRRQTPTFTTPAQPPHSACLQRDLPQPRRYVCFSHPTTAPSPRTLPRPRRRRGDNPACMTTDPPTTNVPRVRDPGDVCIRSWREDYLSSPVAVRMKPAIMNQPPPTQNRIRVHRGWTG